MRRKQLEAKYSLEHVERLHIFHVLELAGGNKTHAAEWLGIGLRTLQRKLNKWSALSEIVGKEEKGEVLHRNV